MFVYRICGAPYAALDGEGARLFGGRWNTPGNPAVYTSLHLSLAVLEYLVHVEIDNLPSNLIWLKIEIPEKASIERFPGAAAPNERDAALFGDEWLRAKRSLCLEVPSAILSVERNIILNPQHAEIAKVKTLENHPFKFDERLF